MSRTIALGPLLFVLAACGGQAGAGFKEPPAASFAAETHQITVAGATTSAQAAAVTPEFFGAAGVQPVLGRFFIGGDFASDAQRSVVLSRTLWTERLGGAPTVIGQSIEIDGRPAVIVGIAPPGFDFPPGVRFWTPKKP